MENKSPVPPEVGGASPKVREIKFRVWSPKRKMMLPAFDLYQYMLWSENAQEEYGTYDGIILQFTGLKDSKGAEIYEGDILDSIWVVRWHDGHFVLDDHGAKEEFSAASIRNDVVIGNIHQHPHLLRPDAGKEAP